MFDPIPRREPGGDPAATAVRMALDNARATGYEDELLLLTPEQIADTLADDVHGFDKWAPEQLVPHVKAWLGARR